MVGELKYAQETYTLTAADAAGTGYVQRNYAPDGIRHGIDAGPGPSYRPQRWRVHQMTVGLTDANSQAIAGVVVKMGPLHFNGTSFNERQACAQGLGQAACADVPFECDYGVCWQIHKSLMVAGYIMNVLVVYEVLR